MKAKPTIVIAGKRWFQRTYGNTYHSVTVTMPDGKQLYSGQHYGYGSGYLQTAYAMIRKEWANTRRKPLSENGGMWELRERANVIESVADVARERDL